MRQINQQFQQEIYMSSYISKRDSMIGFQECVNMASKMAWISTYSKLSKFNISIDMAKQICMIQRSPEGKQIRQYFLDLEKAWNTPEQIFARALKMADKTIDQLKSENATLIEDNERMKPHAILGHAIAAANTSILVGALAKILKQNGVETGQRRLFEWLRNNGYLIKQKGNDWNMPTQKSMEMGLFEIKESVHIDGNGCNRITRTPKVTGKGQQYFINKFLAAE